MRISTVNIRIIFGLYTFYIRIIYALKKIVIKYRYDTDKNKTEVERISEVPRVPPCFKAMACS